MKRRKQFTEERGQAIVILALTLIGLMGMVALAIDGGRLYTLRRDAQNAVDSAVMAAARARCLGNVNSDAATFAFQSIDRSGYSGQYDGYYYDGGSETKLVETTEEYSSTVKVNIPPVEGNNIGDNDFTEVILEAQTNGLISSIVFQGPLKTRVRSSAICTNARPENDWRGSVWGGAGAECTNPVSITPSDGNFVGGIHSNGDIHTGSGTDTTVEGGISCGGTCDSGGFTTPDGSVPEQGIPPESDPISLDVDIYAPTGYRGELYQALGQYYYFDPAVESQSSLNRDWLIENGYLVDNTGPDAAAYPKKLLPGLYFSEGDINLVFSGGGVRGAGVVFVARGTVGMSGSEIALTAPPEEGLLIYAARDMGIGGSACSTNIVSLSGSNVSWVGTIYAPHGAVGISASGTGSLRGAIVAYAVSMSGSQMSVIYDQNYWPSAPPSVELGE